MLKLLRPWLIAGALAGATTATAQLAPAQPAPAEPMSQEQLNAARESFRSGKKKLEAGDYEGALIDFRIADAVVKKPSTRTGVARALIGLGRLAEARKAALSVASMPAPPDEHPTLAKARKDASALAEELLRRVAQVSFAVTPAGSELTLDGQLLTAAQHGGLDVDPGEHTVSATGAGFHPLTRSFTVKQGEQQRISMTLVPLSEPPPEPITGGEIGSGADAASGGPVFGPVAWTGVGLAGAGLIIGAVAGGITLSRASEIETICTSGDDGKDCLEPEHDERSAALLSAHVSTAGFVLAGVGVGVGLVGLLALDQPEQPAEGDVAVTPLIGPGFVGMRGTF